MTPTDRAIADAIAVLELFAKEANQSLGKYDGDGTICIEAYVI